MVDGYKSYRWLALQAWLLLGAAAVFAVSVQSLALPIVTGLGVAVSFAKRRPLAPTARAWIWTLVGCGAVCLLVASPAPSESVRFSLMASHRLCPLLVGVGLAMTFFEQRPASLGAQATCVFIAVVLACGNEADRVDFAAMRRMQAGLMLAMLLPLGALVQRAAVGITAKSAGHTHRRAGRLPGLVVALLLAGGVCTGVQLSLFSWSETISDFLNEWARNRSLQQVGRQSPRADLRRTSSAKKGGDVVILRVWADRAPGYLRLIAYPVYEHGVWQAVRATRSLAEGEAPAEVAPLQRFTRPADLSTTNTGAWVTWRVQPTRSLASDYLPLPGGAEQIDIVAEKLRGDRDGSVRAEGWLRASGYAVQLPAHGAPAAYPRAMGDAGEEAFANADPYLAVPAGVVTGLLQRLAEWQVPPVGAPAAAIVEAVCVGLQTHLTYRLGVSLDPHRDPVLQFLERGEGHCELFAAAATLLLRERGVRARYVSGFVCEEQHASRRYWVARGSSGHAWAEAYLPESGGWVLVEATPANGRPESSDQFTAWERRLDPLLAALRQAWGALRSGAALQGLRLGLAYGLIWLGEHLAAVGTLIVGVGGVWLAWQVRRARHATSAQRRRLDVLRRRMDRRLASAGYARPPQVTLREGVAAAIDLPPAQRQALLAQVSDWERERYGA